MLTFLFVLFFGAFLVFAAAAVAAIWLMTMFVVAVREDHPCAGRGDPGGCAGRASAVATPPKGYGPRNRSCVSRDSWHQRRPPADRTAGSTSDLLLARQAVAGYERATRARQVADMRYRVVLLGWAEPALPTLHPPCLLHQVASANSVWPRNIYGVRQAATPQAP